MTEVESEYSESTIEVERRDDPEDHRQQVILSFRFEQYGFSDETAKRLGEALIEQSNTEE